MGTFIHTLGKINIPEEKRKAFIEDAKLIADKAGLFGYSYTSVFGQELWLLSFPSFDPSSDNRCADFTYSYYEKRSWENAGIDLEDYVPYSEKIGWLQFNQAVQALYFLAELYSDTPFVSYNDSLNRPQMTIKWLRFALDRDIEFPNRKNLWTIFELLAERELKYYGKIKATANRIISDFQGDIIDNNSLLDVVIVTNGAEAMINATNNETLKKPDDKLSYSDFMRIYRNGVVKYKETSDLYEDKQIEFLLNLFTCDESDREKYRKDDKLTGIMFGTALISPIVAVKIISEIYDTDFWELWKTIRGRITISSALKFDETNDGNGERHETITTEQYFSCSSDDRLYWWKKDSDVLLSEEIKERLNGLSLKHKALCSNDLSGDITTWQKRLVGLLATHSNIYCFEQMFYEFIGSFHDDRYRAAVLLLEEVSQDDDEYRRLLALFANPELRREYYAF